MNGIIITGHGNFATGVSSAVKLVFGETDNFYAIDFTQDVTPETLENRIIEKINLMKNMKGVLIFTDIAGGTPFKSSVMISLREKNIKVLGGTNLAMLLEVLASKDDCSLDELYSLALEIGKDEVKGFEVKQKENNESDDDGI